MEPSRLVFDQGTITIVSVFKNWIDDKLKNEFLRTDSFWKFQFKSNSNSVYNIKINWISNLNSNSWNAILRTDPWIGPISHLFLFQIMVASTPETFVNKLNLSKLFSFSMFLFCINGFTWSISLNIYFFHTFTLLLILRVN